MSRSIESQKLINEKTIQRYIFEELNYGNKDVLKEFYPDRILKSLDNRKIKVIIPEYKLECKIVKDGKEQLLNTITDFRIIYNDNSAHNVEVEWITSRFAEHKQEVYDNFYKNGKGFLIVLDDDSSDNSKVSYIDNSDVKRISAEKFAYWYASKSKHIVDETIRNYVPNYIPKNQRVWLIYLPSSGAYSKNSMSDYLTCGRKKGKWAFTYSNKGKHMANILEICSGDIAVFIWGLNMLNGTHQRQISINNDWYVSGVDLANITKGYYCDFGDDTFESDEWKANRITENKEYMHYFNFDRKFLFTSIENRNIKSEQKILYKDSIKGITNRQSDLEGVIEQFAWSLNNQGAPAEISINQLNAIIKHLGLLR